MYEKGENCYTSDDGQRVVAVIKSLAFLVGIALLAIGADLVMWSKGMPVDVEE